MLKVSGLSKSYETQEILRDMSFVLNGGEKAGLVGPNGSGKSTLLRTISGLEHPDAGSVWLDPGDSVGYLPQYPAEELALSVRESLLRGAGTAGALMGRVAELEQQMPRASGKDLDRLLEEYATVQAEFERLGGYELEDRIAGVVRGLEIDARLDGPVGKLSGGNKTKLGLARLLLSGATVLLLDEPTNYLDLPALLWLERWVRESHAACVIVSHDRRFLDETVGEILEIDAQKHTLRAWPGNYSAYADARAREEEKQLSRWLDQQARKKRIEEDIRRTKEQARGVESGTNLDTARRYAKKVAAKAKAREGRLERELARDEVEQPVRTWGLHLADLGKGDIDDDRTVLHMSGLHAGYPRHVVLRGVDLRVHGRDRLALLGANGSGKSTLLRCLTGMAEGDVRTAGFDLQASAGAEVRITSGEVRLGGGVRLGMLSQEAAELPRDQTVYDVFRAGTYMYEDEARAYLHKFLFGEDEVRKRVESLSYGQRAKLALALLVLGEANFLVLDEPTSHMDMAAIEAIETAIADYTGPLLVVSHDRYFLDRIGITRTEVMDDGHLHSVDGIAEYEVGLEAKLGR